jgi:phosphoribosyl 1,2-cyclic phosphodiesterase
MPVRGTDGDAQFAYLPGAEDEQMGLRFTVLASGSAGNASLVDADGFGVLIDIGLGPRQLSSRLSAAGLSWADVDAVLLTHTHSDHWKERTLAYLIRHRVPLFCHPGHHDSLDGFSSTFARLHAAGLVRPFAAGEAFELSAGLRCRALPVRHDAGATFGFRFEGAPDLFGKVSSLAYAADLGCWDDGLADALADVDLLAVEFNHDVELEYASGRMPRLIARVLGDEGHLSNAQAADLVRAVLARSPSGRPRHLVQLHLSRECNRPALARAAARAALADRTDVTLYTAEQDSSGPTLHLGPSVPSPRRARPARSRRRTTSARTQPWLPGFADGPADAAG